MLGTDFALYVRACYLSSMHRTQDTGHRTQCRERAEQRQDEARSIRRTVSTKLANRLII